MESIYRRCSPLIKEPLPSPYGDREALETWGNNKTATAVLDSRGKPRVDLLFSQAGLIDIAEQLLKAKPSFKHHRELTKALKDNNFPPLSQNYLGVKSIHISERDTQQSHRTPALMNLSITWSVMGLYEEGIAPAELGWGNA